MAGALGMKVGVGSEDLIRQAETLRLFPEIADRHYVPAMNQMVMELAAVIEPNIPRATGRLADAFSIKVTGHGLSIQGQVGWLAGVNGAMNMLVHLVDQDVKPHQINSYVPNLGVYVGLHPGHKGYQFMQKGLDAAEPIIETVGGAANEAVVQELAIK